MVIVLPEEFVLTFGELGETLQFAIVIIEEMCRVKKQGESAVITGLLQHVQMWEIYPALGQGE